MRIAGREVSACVLATLSLALVLASSPPVFAHANGGPVEEAVTGVKGPFTIEGVVYDPQGRPAVNCPVRFLPVLPGKGVDGDNLFYKIPNRNDHRTVTDANGRFKLVNIVDYPEVKNHTYRVVVNADHNLPYVQPVGNGVISLATATTNHLFLEVHTEPAAIVKLVARDRAGRPYTGTRAVSISARKGIRYVRTVQFENGVARFYTSPGDAQNPGQIALFRWETSKEAKLQEMAQGREPGLYNRVLYGLQAQKNIVLLPGQETAVEFVLTE